MNLLPWSMPGDGIPDAARRQLALGAEAAHIAVMLASPLRLAALLTVLAAAAALGFALALENWGGLVPCALCLVERWPYRVALVFGAAALFAPPRLARALLWLAVLTVLVDAAVAFVHVGVEAKWWPSPLPECAAPRFSGGSIAERLASMPARPAKPCDEPTYLVPGVSLAMANMVFALAFAAVLAWGLGRRRTRR